MKLILPLIALFLLGCVLYGIYAGVAAIVRSTRRVGAGSPCIAHRLNAAEGSRPTPQPRSTSITTELQALFALHQSGALTREEFERLKAQALDAHRMDAERKHPDL